MFKISQILSASHMIRNFSRIARFLQDYPQPLLIIQKKGPPLVLVNGEIFEDLLVSKLGKDGIESNVCDVHDVIDQRF